MARSEDEVFDDDEVRLVAGAAITSDRCALGLRVLASGKDYFTDKAPLTTLDQLQAAREATARTGLNTAVYYSECLHVEAAVLAGQLIDQGAVGRVLQVMGSVRTASVQGGRTGSSRKRSTAASCATSAATTSSRCCTSPAPRTP